MNDKLTDCKTIRAGLTITAGLIGGVVAASVGLSLCLLLYVLQADFVAHLEGLAHCPHYTHGLHLTGGGKRLPA